MDQGGSKSYDFFLIRIQLIKLIQRYSREEDFILNVSATRNKATILNHWNIIESLTLLEFWVDSKNVMVSQSSRVLVKTAIK